MRFHSCVAVCPTKVIERRDCDSEADPRILASCMAFEQVMPFTRTFETNLGEHSVLVGIMRRSAHGVGLFNMELSGVVGMGLLVLAGKKPRLEQKYACEFMRRMAFAEWKLPLPPLEIDRRPLIYVVLFRLGGPGGEEWYDLAGQMVHHAYGFSLSFLQSQCLP